jgi:hypothetical protein
MGRWNAEISRTESIMPPVPFLTNASATLRRDREGCGYERVI